MVRRSVKKLEDLFRINKLDFVSGMTNLLFKFSEDEVYNFNVIIIRKTQ
jgi:hypothetical protein